MYFQAKAQSWDPKPRAEIQSLRSRAQSLELEPRAEIHSLEFKSKAQSWIQSQIQSPDVKSWTQAKSQSPKLEPKAKIDITTLNESCRFKS